MLLNVGRMIERRKVSPGLVPFLAMVLFLTLSAPALISASASDTAPQPPSVQTVPEAVEPPAEPQVIPALFVPAGTPEAAAMPVDTGPVEIGTINITSKKPIAVAPRDMSGLAGAVQQLIASSGASVGVTVIELGGADPTVWSVNGGGVFTAASTYKLAAMMLEAQNIATGKSDPNGKVCYQESDWEDGWFADYEDGMCFTRNELAIRGGKFSCVMSGARECSMPGLLLTERPAPTSSTGTRPPRPTSPPCGAPRRRGILVGPQRKSGSTRRCPTTAR